MLAFMPMIGNHTAMKLSRLGEFGLIRALSRNLRPSRRVFLGIGDDCAAVAPSRPGHLLLLTCDPVIEDIHFDSTATAYQIGWKAMARNLSDIAAMGGTPLYALVSASLPRGIKVARALEIHRGVKAAAKRYGVDLVGGDTSHNLHGIHLTITLVGEVARSELVTRSGASAGHLVCITGSLGASLQGKHLRFSPRIEEGRFLAKHFKPSAMMDLSDGLASDLQRIGEASKVGFEIWGNRLPLSPELRAEDLSPSKAIARAMQDGEDYELLFTLPKKQWLPLKKAWQKKFRIPLTTIGIVRTQTYGIQLKDDAPESRPQQAPRPANDHFR